MKKYFPVFFVLIVLAGLARAGWFEDQEATIAVRNYSVATPTPTPTPSALTVGDDGYNSAYASGNLAASAVNLPSGSTIYVFVGVESATTALNTVSDTAGNSWSYGTLRTYSSTNARVAYCIGATGNASNVVTATFANDSTARKNINVLVFTPGSGETISLDVTTYVTAYDSSSPVQTNTANTTGTDEICIAGFQAQNSAVTYSNQEIPGGTAATTLTIGDTETTVFYRVLTATVSNILAEADISIAQGFAGEMNCFKSE